MTATGMGHKGQISGCGNDRIEEKNRRNFRLAINKCTGDVILGDYVFGS